MEIRFISSLMPDDEIRIAAAMVDLVSALLNHGALAYTLEVETASGTTFQCTHTALREQTSPDESTERPSRPSNGNKSKDDGS